MFLFNGSDYRVVASYLSYMEKVEVKDINSVWLVFTVEQLFTVLQIKQYPQLNHPLWPFE